MKKESGRRHHYVPRSYLKRFAAGKKHRLHVEEIRDQEVVRTFNPNVASFLVECGIYDLSSFTTSKTGHFDNVDDGFLEDLVFAQIHEPLYNKSLKQSIDLNLVPDTQTCKGLIQGAWTLYLRTPRIKRMNSRIAEDLGKEIDEARREFMNNFGMVTAKTILKLFPKTLVHTKTILFNAVGRSKFLTTDHPSIPCVFQDPSGRVAKCDEYRLQQAVILADEWPSEVGLLCALSPSWCMWTASVNGISTVEHQAMNSEAVDRLNEFIRESADRFVILPPTR